MSIFICLKGSKPAHLATRISTSIVNGVSAYNQGDRCESTAEDYRAASLGKHWG
jgi:uncharacterized Zn-binding protein involved in type VI secretion